MDYEKKKKKKKELQSGIDMHIQFMSTGGFKTSHFSSHARKRKQINQTTQLAMSKKNKIKTLLARVGSYLLYTQ